MMAPYPGSASSLASVCKAHVVEEICTIVPKAEMRKRVFVLKTKCASYLPVTLPPKSERARSRSRHFPLQHCHYQQWLPAFSWLTEVAGGDACAWSSG